MRPGRRAAAAALVLAAAAACGKKGPPLPPLRPDPARVEALSARRVDARVELRFTVPAANADGSTPAVADRVEIYAVATDAAAPAPRGSDMLDRRFLHGRVGIRPAGGADAAAPGAPAVYADTVSPDLASPEAAAAGRVVHYLVVAVTGRDRTGPLSRISVPLGPAPAAPVAPSLDWDERTLRLAWQPGGGPAAFRVYATDAAGRELEGRPIGDAPLAAAEFTAPVEFGRERCFVIRAVTTAGPAAVEGPAAGPVCATPADTFPPPAPAGLEAIPEPGAIVLIWNAVEAADLAGYLVLRGDGTGDRLNPLTPAPIRETTYRDAAVRPGGTYVYAVVAVDAATPPNRSAESARREATARIAPGR